MLTARFLLTALLLPSLGWAAAPAYSTASIVNTATGQTGSFAPNSMVSIYGTDLAYGTQGIGAGEVFLPRSLAGVEVKVNGSTAYLFYVSPRQINFILPPLLLPGPVKVSVLREGIEGPILPIALDETAPGFFVTGEGQVIGTHADGRLITPDAPAVPEEVVVLYCAGLGRTDPDAEPGRAANRPAPILLRSTLGVLLGSVPVDSGRILYAGITPGFAGLYQINLRIPAGVPADPEVRIFIGPQGSPSFLKLPVRVQ